MKLEALALAAPLAFALAACGTSRADLMTNGPMYEATFEGDFAAATRCVERRTASALSAGQMRVLIHEDEATIDFYATTPSRTVTGASYVVNPVAPGRFRVRYFAQKAIFGSAPSQEDVMYGFRTCAAET